MTPSESKTNQELVIFTQAYPFGRLDNFIEEELKVVSPRIPRITIQPMTYEGCRKAQRTPKNVVVRQPLLPESRLRKLLVAGSRLFSYSDLRDEFFRRRVFLKRERMYNYLLAAGVKYYMHKAFDDLVALCRNSTVYFYWGCGAVYCIRELKQASRSRTVVRFHGGDLYEELNSGYLPLRPPVLEFADCVCPVSSFGQRYLLGKYPAIGPRITVSRLGTVDMGPGRYCPNPNGIVLVSCACMIPLKRLHLIAEMLGEVKGINVTWHHFGDGSERSRVEAIVSSHPKNVTSVLHGHVPNQEVLDFYSSNHVDAFVSVSESEGVPVSIMEATSFGLPVIATNAGGTAEILHTEGSVLLQKEFGVGEFLSALNVIQGMSQSTNVRDTIRRHWQQVASAETNYADFADRILKGNGSI